MSNNRPHLIIDGLNTFIRYYAASPSMDTQGEPTGGVVGFIKTLQALVKRIIPCDVYCIWESSGSQRRRTIYPEYKSGRKPIKTNRTYETIEDSEENKVYQIKLLTSLLKNLPVYQIYIENAEADDVIAYLTNLKFKNDNKVIVSSDKDFYQLLDDKTTIYNIGKKLFINSNYVINEYKISPENFVVARSFDGDKSDNINGVQRVGLKVLSNKFDLLSSKISIEDIINISEEKTKEKKPLKIYQNIVNEADIVRRNYKLMLLDSSMLSISQVNKINDSIDNFIPAANKIKFVKKYMENNLSGVDCENLFSTLYYLSGKK